MLQNFRVTAMTNFELLRENQLGGKITPSPPRLGLKDNMYYTALSFGQIFLKRQYRLKPTVFWSKFLHKRLYGWNHIAFSSKFVFFLNQFFSVKIFFTATQKYN